ncbi:MAG: aminoglycoside phosphotransferase family protein [Burkholderiales bacterium]|nr:MAG: aminoglycoside phosphotransferase family protein [Burkholderiales bacterium]
MHDDQLHIDTEIARAMLAEQFPQYGDEPVVRLPSSGTVNAIFRVGRNATARFPLQPQDAVRAAERLASEAQAAGEFAMHCTVPAPRSLGIGRPGPGYPMPWTLQNWIAGDIATPHGLAASDAFANDLAELIAALRSVDVDGQQFDGIGRGGQLMVHDDWMATCFANSEGLLQVERLTGLWAWMRKLPTDGPDVMSHKDLIPANLLVRDGRLAGVLDAGSFGPADPALDLVAAWHLFDAERRTIIGARLGSSEVEWQRGAAWAFVQAMGLVWYYLDSNPTMAALGRSTLDRLLGDPVISTLP